LLLSAESFDSELISSSSSSNSNTILGLERYWHCVIGYWAIFADIG